MYREEKDMLRAEITIFRDKSDPVHYLEHRAKDIVSILWKNDVDVTKVTFQEINVNVMDEVDNTVHFIK